MNNGLFQPPQFPMLDPNGTTNGIPNSAINASRQRANGGPASQPPPEQWLSPEELRARNNKMSMGMPEAPVQMGAPMDGSTMYPAEDPSQFGMPTNSGQPPAQDAQPTYTGQPVIDKYIHTFIGS